MPNKMTPSELSAPGKRRGQRERSMRKARNPARTSFGPNTNARTLPRWCAGNTATGCERVPTLLFLTRKLPNCFRMPPPSTLPCGPWRKSPRTPAPCGGARRESARRVIPPSFPAELASDSSVVHEVQNLLEIFPGLALGVLIVSPQQVRGVVRHHHRHLAPLEPLAPHLGDAFLVAGEGAGGGAA